MDTGTPRDEIELIFKSLSAAGEYLAAQSTLEVALGELDDLLLQLNLRSDRRSTCEASLRRIRIEHADRLDSHITERDDHVGQLFRDLRDVIRDHLWDFAGELT